MFMLLTALALATGCCSFGNRCNQANIATARELTSSGLSALYKGQTDEATRLLSQACEANPEDCRIRHHLASSLVEQGQIERAIAQLKLAIEQSPEDPALPVELGKLSLHQGQPYAARQQANHALDINRQMAAAWLLRGRSEREAGQLDDALDSLHRAAACSECCPSTRLELAAVWIQKGEPLRALTNLEIYNSDFAEDRIPMDAVHLTGHSLVELQQYERARQILQPATSRNESTPEIWILLSRAQYLAGDVSAAQLTAASARQVFPDNPEISRWLDALSTDVDPALQAAR